MGMEPNVAKQLKNMKKSFDHGPRNKYPLFSPYDRISLWHSVIWIRLRLRLWALSTLSKDENAAQLSRRQTASIARTVPGGLRLIFPLSTHRLQGRHLPSSFADKIFSSGLFQRGFASPTSKQPQRPCFLQRFLYLVLWSRAEFKWQGSWVDTLPALSPLGFRAMHGMKMTCIRPCPLNRNICCAVMVHLIFWQFLGCLRLLQLSLAASLSNKFCILFWLSISVCTVVL